MPRASIYPRLKGNTKNSTINYVKGIVFKWSTVNTEEWTLEYISKTNTFELIPCITDDFKCCLPENLVTLPWPKNQTPSLLIMVSITVVGWCWGCC